MRDDTVFEEDGSEMLPARDVDDVAEPVGEEAGHASDYGAVRGDITVTYFREIHKIRRLSPQQEIDLGREVQSGSADARQRFISANLRLVISIAKRFHWRCTAAISLIDLIQEGNIGLVKAVGRFDPEAGFRFSTYATYLIRQAIESYLRKHARAVRSPVHIQNLHKKYDDTVAILSDELGRTPSTDEIALAMGMKSSTVESFQNYHNDLLSLSNGVAGDDGMELLDVIPDERMRPDRAFFDQEAGRSISDQVLEVVENLPHPQGAIIKLRFGLETDEILSPDATAIRLGISVDTVRKYERLAQNLLRRKLSTARQALLDSSDRTHP
jgi:RNA polymerase primary sigma factor